MLSIRRRRSATPMTDADDTTSLQEQVARLPAHAEDV